MVDTVHADYITDLSLVRISSTDARLAPVSECTQPGRQYKYTQTGTEAGINSCINVSSIGCAPRVSTKHYRSFKQKLARRLFSHSPHLGAVYSAGAYCAYALVFRIVKDYKSHNMRLSNG